MEEEVDAYDRTSDVGHHESPREIAAESQVEVEVEGQPSVSVDGGAVGSAEVVTCPFSASWYEFAGEHADVGTRVDQETLICVPIPDKEAACCSGADIYRRRRLPR
jgi:hypothetical protein